MCVNKTKSTGKLKTNEILNETMEDIQIKLEEIDQNYPVEQIIFKSEPKVEANINCCLCPEGEKLLLSLSNHVTLKHPSKFGLSLLNQLTIELFFRL